ncbi:hypothetical protein, partial [Paracoccus alkanivorans]|uniref:hypothetical protein n=1 Tax=Paracoccus alkanivorans TaxID=2116655 RepID=UPI001AA09D30
SEDRRIKAGTGMSLPIPLGKLALMTLWQSPQGEDAGRDCIIATRHSVFRRSAETVGAGLLQDRSSASAIRPAG